jgi:Immunoglobulin I-set domain/Immunoglobulin domain
MHHFLRSWHFVAAVLAFVLLSEKLHAAGFVDGFEVYVQGALDANLTGGPNEGTNGGANPWFGGNPPNIRVVGAENGVTPHSGTNMIRGCYNCLYDKDTDWYNLSFRNGAGGVFLGNFVLDWWFYDPLGSGGGGDYVDYLALGNYSDVPPDMDYTDISILPSPGSQRMCLGSDALRFNTDIDATMYQARILGATDGANPEGWFNLTNAIRSVGWHHARIVVGAPNGPDTPASFYIDDMVVPALTHGTINADGFNILEINGDYGNTSGYFDDFTFQDNVTAPTFTTGPTNVTVLAGGTAIFNVSGGNGTPSPSYSWRKDGAPVNNGGNISGATTATLTITSCTAGNAGTYSCLVSNIAGVAVATATLTVIIPPTIDSQSPPGGPVSAGAGGTVNFSVTAHATHPINYQWSKSGTGNLTDNGHFTGTTTSSLTINTLVAGDAGSYSCHLSNADGATDSAAVTLSIASGPTITLQPTNQVVPFNSNVSFVVSAAGSSLVYRWSQGATPLNNGGRISGATSNVLTINGVADADAGSYSCFITNSGGSITSAAATLTVVHLPVINSQPVSQVASNGSTVGFHVVASGSLLSYQWKKNGTSLSNGGDFSGATTPDLSIHVTSQTDEAIYSATVSNPAGSVTSSGAALRLNQRSTNFFDDFESYSNSSPVTYGRFGTPLDYNYGPNSGANDPWWGPSPPNFFTFLSGQDGVTAYSGSQMTGGAYNSVTSGDNDEAFLNLSYRFNGGQLYYGNVMLDWYFYDPGTSDAGDQLSLANFNTRMPPTSDSTGFQIPAGPVQHLFIGTWQNLDTTKYQASVFGASDGTLGRISKNIAGNTKYFDTSALRSVGWHHARIVVGPADPGTHVANAKFFVDDMSNAAFSHDLPPANVGFNSIHLMACSIYAPATSETAGFFDDVTFQVVNDPYIIQQPVNQTNAPGTTATFTVVGMGTGYQWKKNGVNIGGATSATLVLSAVGPTDVASYTCVVTGANGSLTSSPATLTLLGGRPFLTATLIGTDVVVTWTGSNPLLSSTNVNGPYLAIPGATSPYTNKPPLGTRFFGLGQ